MKVNNRLRNSVDSENCRDLGNIMNSDSKPQLQNFSGIKRNSVRNDLPRSTYNPTPRMSLNVDAKIGLPVYNTRKSTNIDIPLRCKANKSSEKLAPKCQNSREMSQNQSMMCTQNCLNHTNKKGIFSIVCRQNEQLKYCSVCAINLLLQQFPIHPIKGNNLGITSQQALLVDLVQCHSQANKALEELQQKSGMKMVKQQVQQIEERYSRIFFALEEMKRQEIMRLQLQKLSIFDSISKNESMLCGIKKKVCYMLSELSTKLESEHISHSMRDFYTPMLKNIKNELNKCKQFEIPVRPTQDSPRQSEYKNICHKLNQYFSERVFELSFDGVQQSEQEKPLRESLLHESKIINVNEQSNEIISFEL